MTPRRDDPRRIARDLKLLWIDARCAHATMKRRPRPEIEAASAAPADVLERVEDELAGEANRYNAALRACIGVALMPALLSGVLWSGMYWLPVRIYWWPFDRGEYGLPYFSLYEWLAYLLLAVFFAYGFALIGESKASTHRLSADYRRLAHADPEARRAFAREVVAHGFRRTELVLRTSRIYADYPELLDTHASTATPYIEEASG